MEIAQLEKLLIQNNTFLRNKIDEQPGLVEAYAQAEHDYRIALASKMLDLKTSGQSATLIPDIAKGDKAIASLKLKRDIAEGINDACRESIRATMSKMSAIQSLISAYRAEMNLR
jgi:hypothetical protein